MIRHHESNGQHDFIRAYYLDDPIIDEILEFYEGNKENHFEGAVAGYDKVGYVDKDWKESTDCHMVGDLRDRYLSSYLQKSLDEYMNEYEELKSSSRFSVTSPVNIQKYLPSQGFKAWHCERGGNTTVNRVLFFITYLNDVNDAGETEFMYQKFKLKAEKGLTLISPVDWNFTHRGVTSPTETKYIATGWYTFEPIEWSKSILRNRIKK